MYQDVTITPGTIVKFTGFAGTHTPGLSCSPKLSLVFRSASGAVLSQTDVAITRDVDVNFNQLALYTMTATAPAGTAKVRVQSSISCNYVKMDAFCLRTVASLSRPSLFAAEPETKTFEGFDVLANPNPVVSSFNVVAKSSDNATAVNIRVTSADGRVVAVQKITANSTIKIDAAHWRTGVYFVEAVQGKQRKIVRLVKL